MVEFKVSYDYEIMNYLLKKEAHGREISKELKISLTKVQSTLNDLRNLNFLDYKIEGKNHIYFIKKSLASQIYLLNVENYKLLKLLKKHPLLEEPFKDIVLKYPDSLIILFGSYAKNNPKDESDIDIYVDTNDKKIKESIQDINPKFSVKIGEFNKEDLLIKEIIKNHVIINRGDKFYEKLTFLE